MSVTIDKKTLEEILKSAMQSVATTLQQQQTSPYEVIEEPVETEEETESVKYDELITVPSDISSMKTLQPFKTETLLDTLFLHPDGTPLDGIPIVAQLGITGLAGSGKSILIEEIAVRCANRGENVLLVSSEDVFQADTPRFDLQSRMMQKAQILKLDWNTIKEHLWVLDCVEHPELREWKSFADVYRYVITSKNITLALIDSVTMLEDYRGRLKYRLMELSRFNQVKGVTALYVNQRATEDFDKYAMAGGMGLPHTLDGTILVDYGRAYYKDQQQQLNASRGDLVRFVRVMDCRLCGFIRERIPVVITSDGFLRRKE